MPKRGAEKGPVVIFRGKRVEIEASYLDLLKTMFPKHRARIDALAVQLRKDPENELAQAEFIAMVDQIGGLDICRKCGAPPARSGWGKFCNVCGMISTPTKRA